MIKNYNEWINESSNNSEIKDVKFVSDFFKCKVFNTGNFYLFKGLIKQNASSDEAFYHNGVFYAANKALVVSSTTEDYFMQCTKREEINKNWKELFNITHQYTKSEVFCCFVLSCHLRNFYRKTKQKTEKTKNLLTDLMKLFSNDKGKTNQDLTIKEFQMEALKHDLSNEEKKILHITDSFIHDNRGRIKSHKFGL